MDVVAPEKTDLVTLAYEAAIIGITALAVYQVGSLSVGWTKEIVRSRKAKKTQTEN